MKKSLNTGFTLIELVIVIVILGILAAAALPRFSDLASDARTATVNGIAGSLRSASAIAHATQLAKSYSLGQTVSLEGIAIAMSNGYPAANTATGSVVSTLTDITGFTVVASTGSVTFTATGRTLGQCTAEYTAAPNSITAASVSVITTGC